MDATVMPIPDGLVAPGVDDQPFVRLWPADDLAAGQMRRFTSGDLDVLVAHTPVGHLRDRRSLPAHGGAAVARLPG